MRVLVLIGFMLTGSISFAQSRWSFAIEMQAGISGKKTAERNDSRDAGNNVIRIFENGQKRGPAFAGGATVGFRLFPFLELRSGLSFQGEQNGWYDASNDVRPASPRASDYRYEYQLQAYRLELPTSLRFRFLAKRTVGLRPFVEVGARPGWFMGGEYATVHRTANQTGPATQVYPLQASAYRERFFTPVFVSLGLEFRRVSLSVAYHQETTFSYGEQAFWFCGVGGPFSSVSSHAPYITQPGTNRNWMAKISYRLF